MNFVRNVLVIVGLGVVTWFVCWTSHRKDMKSGKKSD